MELFGFKITKATEDKTSDLTKNKSIVPPDIDDGSTTVAAGGYYGQYIDIDGNSVKTDAELIRKYRITAEQPECDMAIEDIVNEAIVSDDDQSPIEVNLDALDQPDKIKDAIREEFDNVVKLLNFNENGHDIFRRWYIDGRIFYHVIVDEKNLKKGIQEVRSIDALKIRKVREIKEELDEKTGAKLVTGVEEYFMYTENGVGVGNVDTGFKIAKEAIIYITSGLLDYSKKRVLSHLNKAIKPANMLRMMEDSLVIYRLARAPERRIFYIDVGNLPKGKAEEYLRGVMSRYRNKLVYDAQSGEFKDDRKHMSMLEDFWLPRREGGRGTEISTLPGGENLGQIDDIIYFQKKLYKSLNVPVNRLEQESQFSMGRSSEITRDELKFQKFVNRLRKRFSLMFMDLLKTQLILKGIINKDDWDDIKEQIAIDYIEDNHFSELKDSEMLRERLNTLQLMENYVGTYFSREWVKRSVLRMNDEEIDKMQEEIDDEKEKDGPEDVPMGGGGQPMNVKPEEPDVEDVNLDQ